LWFLDGKILVEDLVKLASEIEDAEAEETDEPTTKS
jgi:LETM1 and EF-hand domain-containing protein 1